MKSLCFSYFIKSTKALRILASVSVFGILSLSSFVINPVYISIDKAEGATGTATESTTSLTLASTATDTSVVLTPGAGFTLSSSTNTSSYDVTTNNYTGYTITLTSEDNDKTLVHTVDNTKVISSINTPIAETDFVSTTSGLMNHFGIKPNKYYDTENNTTIDNTTSSTILPAPGTTGLILDKTTTANSTANNYSIAIGAMVDGTIPAGDYTRDLELVAIANPVAYRVIFNKNTNDTVSNMPTEYSGSTSTTGINIPNTIPERTGYTFAGWCNRKDTLNTCPTGGTTYQPNGAYGIDQTSQNEVTLYAIWQPNYYMQDVAIWGKTLTIGQSMQAIDRRDNKIYWVTKEETDPSNPRAEIDETTGKAFQIWMTQNLDLDLDSTRTYTHADTDLGYTTNNTLATWQPARSTMDNYSNWVDDETSPYSISIGSYFAYTSGSSVADDSTNKDTSYNSLAACTNAGHLAEDCAHYSTGNYYNWPAAISSNDVQNNIAAYTTMPDSICPAGWRLPVGATEAGSRSDYGYLLYQNGVILENYGTNVNQANTFADNGLNRFREAPIWIVRAGNIGSQTHLGWLFVTHVWSSSAYSDYLGIDLAASGTSLSSVGGFLRHYGFSVRCVARPEKTMQTVATWQDELAIGDSVQAADLRDNKIYWVTKEETDAANPRAEIDKTTGKSYQIWMTQNLDYDLKTTETLIPATSDVTSRWMPVRGMIAQNALDSTTWQQDFNAPYAYDDGTTYYYTSGSTSDDTIYTDINDCIPAHDAVSCRHSSGGNLYNWTAAVASNDTSAITSTYTQVPDSICPAGWRLPTGLTAADVYSDYDYLLYHRGVIASHGGSNVSLNYTADGLNILRTAPLWFVRSGYIWQGVHGGAGNDAGYVSSTVANSQFAYNLALPRTGVYPAYGGYRSYGFMIRCIARSTMQDVTAGVIAALTSTTADNNTKLNDKRDGKVYSVGRLSDGSIWMTKNLDLDGGTALYSDTSNVPESYSAAGGTPYYTLPESNIQGFTDNTRAHLYNSGSIDCGVSSPCYSYYNYIAATAGTNPSSGETSYDICPKGWRMPSAAEYNSLASGYANGEQLNNSSWHGTYGGRFYWNTFHDDGGTRALYWTSTADTAIAGEYFSYYATTAPANASANKRNGYPIRCVRNITLQDVSSWKNSLVVDQPVLAIDERDGKKYSVARLSDDTIWMTNNLDLTGGTILTPKDSNVASNFTLPASDIMSTDVYNSGSTVCADGQPCYSYYNQMTATAGTSPSGGVAQYDICPKDWRLPTTVDYAHLSSIYSSGTSSAAVPWTSVYSGFKGAGNSFYALGAEALYWTATTSSADSAYYFSFDTSYHYTYDSGKGTGMAVRCMAK